MRHRLPRRPSGVALLGLLLWLAGGCARGEEPRLVLLLTADTLRADRLGAYGNPLGLTPHLDGLLAESVVFESAFAPCSWTLPSISTLMTGRYPEELGLFSNASRVGAEFATLAGVLGLHGYRTGAVVSNYVLRRGTGFEQGFEHYDATFPQMEANREMPERIGRDTTIAALRVLDRLRADARGGILLWVHYQDPHGPYLAPDDRRERFLAAEREAADGRQRLPVKGQRGLGSIPLYQYVDGEHEVAFYRAGYDAEVSYLDDQIGLLLEAVEARGLLDDAVIVFTADHGEGLGEDDYWFAHGEYLTDPLVRIPLSVRAPGLAPERRRDAAGLVDVFPTLLRLLGMDPPPEYPGRDLLAPRAESADPTLYLAGLRHATVPRFGLVSGGYKYLRSEEPQGVVERLHRLGEDGRDRSSEEPERLAALRERLERFRGELHRAPERRQRLSGSEREHLRALGYVVE